MKLFVHLSAEVKQIWAIAVLGWGFAGVANMSLDYYVAEWTLSNLSPRWWTFVMMESVSTEVTPSHSTKTSGDGIAQR